MKNIRSLMMAVVALGLVAGSATASAQSAVAQFARGEIEPQVVLSLDQLKAQGVYVSCKDDLAYVNGPSVFAPKPQTGETSGFVYNMCMYFTTYGCSTFDEKGQQIGIPGECVKKGRDTCEGL